MVDLAKGGGGGIKIFGLRGKTLKQTFFTFSPSLEKKLKE